jgi:hypothetical protein
MTSARKLKHYKPNEKKIYFRRTDLEAWMLQGEVSTSDEIEARAQTYCIGSKKGGNK